MKAEKERPAELTPMLQHYREVKLENPGTLVLYRLGDFYELFFEDAVRGAELLNITLTTRDGVVPMCGIPHHALDGYLARLVAAGERVAICEQMEDPKQAKGLVRREVVRIVTPGTLTEERILEGKRNNYLVAVSRWGGSWGVAAADLSTGEFKYATLAGPEALGSLWEEVRRWDAAEVIFGPGILQLWEAESPEPVPTAWRERRGEEFTPERGVGVLEAHFQGEGPWEAEAGAGAAGALLGYLLETQRTGVAHLQPPRAYAPTEFLPLGPKTREHLDLFTPGRGGPGPGSLLAVLDDTVTSGGGRWLRRALERPLNRAESIQIRHDAVEELVNDPLRHGEIRAGLKGFGDPERVLARLAVGRQQHRDLWQLKAALGKIPALKETLRQCGADLLHHHGDDLDELLELTAYLRRALGEEEPPGNGKEGVLATGFHPELDRLRRFRAEGQQWLAGFEQRERERTGIRSLRVGYNKVFGYYLEVSRAGLGEVPASYQRKQTLAGGERFITAELKTWEEESLAADLQREELEQELLGEIRRQILASARQIQRNCEVVAEVDGLSALGSVAKRYGYVRPELVDGKVLEIVEGRHPVLEARLGRENFVPNDVTLGADRRLLIVTGPNMGGKSTYLRQIALIVLLAQIGSFVPAKRARLGLVDQIFTRIGAADDLGAGESTFMVEMKEVGNLLDRATERSLILLDEIGRGTSTFDGLSIAWAVAEHLHDLTGARVLLATHYHELVDLGERLPAAANLAVAVRETADGIQFLRRVLPGGADRSYGLQVAKLAGLPPSVLERAAELLAELERSRPEALPQAAVQLRLAPPPPDPILAELRELDLWRLTPLEALAILSRFQEQLKGGTPLG